MEYEKTKIGEKIRTLMYISSNVEYKRRKDLEKEELLRKAVSGMSIEELEEIVNVKKQGRPKNDDKELRQLSKQELNRKKSAKQKADK